MASEAIKVVIVTYNSAGEIAACLDALTLSTVRYALDVTVVDNGSSDDTLAILRERYPAVHAIPSRNGGFAHGCNLGVREALDSGLHYDAIMFLNPDAILPSGAVDRLMAVLDRVPDAVGISPHEVIDPNDRRKPRMLLGAPMRSLPMAGQDVSDSDRLHGCCMLLRPKVFREIGLLDEDYFLYWEELDFSARIRAAGHRLLILHDVLVYHRCGAEERPHRIYYMWRNQFRFARRNFAGGRRALFLGRKVLSQTLELLSFIRTGRWDLALAALAGLTAGLRGETGRGLSRHAVPIATERGA